MISCVEKFRQRFGSPASLTSSLEPNLTVPVTGFVTVNRSPVIRLIPVVVIASTCIRLTCLFHDAPKEAAVLQWPECREDISERPPGF